MIQILWIALGGAAGSVLRYLSNMAVFELYDGKFPAGTLLVNAVGSFLIGVFWIAAPNMNDASKAFLFVGLLGGFTTFSSFSLETLRLFQSDTMSLALFNVVINNVLGIVLCYAGFQLGKVIFQS